MNIILFLTFGLSLQDWKASGLLDRELELYKRLSEKFDLNISIVTYGDISDLDFEYRFKNLQIIPIFKHFRKYNGKFILLLQSLVFPFYIKKISGKNFDIIKTNQLMGCWSAIILKFITRKKLIIRTGYDLYTFSKYDKKSILKRFSYLILTIISLFISNLYTVSSNSDYSLLKNKILVNKKKLVVRKNWVDTESLQISNISNKQVLAVGRLEKQKDFETLIKLFNKLPYSLDIVGDGSLKNYLKSISNTNITFIDKLDHQKLLETYSNYKIYISFSDYEGNSKTLLEAMGSKCLVLASNIKNNSEIIEDGINGYLINKNQPSKIIEKLNYIYENENICTEITENAYKYIVDNHSLNGYVLNEYNDYKHLLSN